MPQRVQSFKNSFPLNRASRLWGQVEQTAVDALDLGGDTGGDMLEQVEGYILHSGGHGDVYKRQSPGRSIPFALLPISTSYILSK